MKITIQKRRVPINPVSLNFYSGFSEKQYKIVSTKESLRLVRISLLLAAFLYLLFGILDIWLVPEHLHLLWGLRLLVSIVLIVFFILSYQKFFKKYMQPMLVVITFVVGAGIIGMVIISESVGGYFYYAGLMLVIQMANGLIRLRFIYATITTFFMSLLYLLIAWGLKNTPVTLLINNSFFLFSTLIIGMFINYSLEYYMRWNFFQRRMLNRQEYLLKSEYNRKTRELEDVRKLQLSILPSRILEHPAIDLAASFNTAVEVGGDYYDYYTDKNDVLTFTIGDAAGHGAQAGGLVTAMKILFTGLSPDKDILTFMKEASAAVKQLKMPRLFMSMIAGRIYDGKLELAGGGLPPALIYRKRSGSIEEIPLKGLPLGFVANPSYRKITVNLHPGDILLFMTDGFPELFNSENKMIGIDKIKEAFSESVDGNPPVIAERLNRTVEDWLNGTALKDDLTFLVFKVKNNAMN